VPPVHLHGFRYAPAGASAHRRYCPAGTLAISKVPSAVEPTLELNSTSPAASTRLPGLLPFANRGILVYVTTAPGMGGPSSARTSPAILPAPRAGPTRPAQSSKHVAYLVQVLSNLSVVIFTASSRV